MATPKETQQQNLHREEENDSESGNRNSEGGGGNGQQLSEDTRRASKHEEEVTCHVSDQVSQPSEDADRKEAIESLPVHENTGTQSDELSSPHHDGLPLNRTYNDEQDIVEIDLDNMGDNLDFAEIGKHCSEFGRASFNSDKKLSKDLVAVNIEETKRNEEGISISKSVNQLKGKLNKTKDKEILSIDNGGDDVFEDCAENDEVTTRASEYKRVSHRRKSMSDAKLHSSDEQLRNENKHIFAADKEDEKIALPVSNVRRKSTTDANHHPLIEKLRKGAQTISSPKRDNTLISGTEDVDINSTKGYARRNSLVDLNHPNDKIKSGHTNNNTAASEGNEIKIPVNNQATGSASNNSNIQPRRKSMIDVKHRSNKENINNENEATSASKIGKTEMGSENNAIVLKPRSRSTPDVKHEPDEENMNYENEVASSPEREKKEMDSASNVSDDQRRRKSSSNTKHHTEVEELSGENNGIVNDGNNETIELGQRSNFLHIHNGARPRKKSDLLTIPEAERENMETNDSPSELKTSSEEVKSRINQTVPTIKINHTNDGNLDLAGITLAKNQEIVGHKEGYPCICEKDGDTGEMRLKGAAKTANDVAGDFDDDKEHIRAMDDNLNHVGYKTSRMEMQGNESDSHTLPVYCAYKEEEYLEETQQFHPPHGANGGIHIQITDLDDDDDDDENGGGHDLEIDFDDLDQVIKDAFEGIDNLSSGVSDNGSIRARSSTFKIGDDSPNRKKSGEDENRSKHNYPRMSVAEAEKLALKPLPCSRTENEVVQQSKDTLSYNDVENISSSLNQNTTDRRGMRSINGLDLGVIKSVSRNIDLSKGTTRSGRHDSEPFSTLNRSRSHLISQSTDDIVNVRIYPPSEKWRILKNLIFISLAFMILFTAFNTTQIFQSSINPKKGLGSWSLVVYYFTLMVSNMFLPVIITKYLGCKGSMVVSCILFAPYLIAQFFPQFYTLLPTSAIAGMGAGVLFCAQGTYASVMAETYMTVTGVDKETTMMLFFGIFFFLYLMSLVWGNLISAQVMLTSSKSHSYISTNLTKFCGANFCPGTPLTKSNLNLVRPADDQLFIIWGILLALVFMSAAVLVIGVDSLSRYNETERANKRGLSGCQLLASSLKHLGNPYQLLLIPVSALGSVSEGLLEADFTYSYISCAWGIPYIGYVMICYGVLLLCFTLLMGCFAVRIIGRLPLMIFCFTLYLGVLAALKFWAPNPEQNIIFFIIAGFWGIADASTVIITAMYGIVFLGHEEAAFCNLGISRALGYLLSYIVHPLLCMDTKMIIVLVILLVAAAGYITFEHLWKKASRDKAMATLVPFKGWVDMPIKSQPRDEG